MILIAYYCSAHTGVFHLNVISESQMTVMTIKKQGEELVSNLKADVAVVNGMQYQKDN